jgi:hypothetical protein
MITSSDLIIFGSVIDHLRERALARAGIRFLKEEEEEEAKAVEARRGHGMGHSGQLRAVIDC